MITLTKTDFNFPNQISKYSGKVREVYKIKDDVLVMISTDRLSAFDVVLPKGIPYKGQILNQIACRMLNATSHIVPNWLILLQTLTFQLEKLASHLRLRWLSEVIYQGMPRGFINLGKE